MVSGRTDRGVSGVRDADAGRGCGADKVLRRNRFIRSYNMVKEIGTNTLHRRCEVLVLFVDMEGEKG